MINHEGLIDDVPKKVLYEEWGDTEDIMKRIMVVINKDDLRWQVKEFAHQFKGRTPEDQYNKLRELWRWCRYEIKYKRDSPPYQIIKHPARTYADRKAGVDCKSLTIFLYFVCRAIGVKCFIRFSAYGKSIQHVYPVAVIENKAVPIDAVHTRFSHEVKPTKIIDKFPIIWKGTGVEKVARSSGESVINGLGSIPDWYKILWGIAGGIGFYKAYVENDGIDKLFYGSTALLAISKLLSK